MNSGRSSFSLWEYSPTFTVYPEIYNVKLDSLLLKSSAKVEETNNRLIS